MAIGRTPNLAARLQDFAKPGCVVIDDATFQQVGRLFECQGFGAVTLKGLPDNVTAWQVIRAIRESRSEALHSAADLSPLVGRDEELDTLLRLWSQAKGRHGRVVLLSGEPGIGKSRLAAGLMERLSGEPHAKLQLFCSPQHQDSPLFPVVAQMARAGYVNGRSPLDTDLPAHQTSVPDAALHSGDAVLIARWIETDTRNSSSPALGAQNVRERLLGDLVAQLTDLAARSPVVILFEDAQWIDNTSLELLTIMVPFIRHLPVLLLVSCRPGFFPSWGSSPHISTVPLSGLHELEAVALARRTAAPVLLPPPVIRQIIARAEGVPLFIEELTRAAVDADWHDGQPRATAHSPNVQGAAVPPALYASLAARLDRLPSLREVIQVAAVIGREFTAEILAAVSNVAEGALADALAGLCEAGLIVPTGTDIQVGYAFRHALIRDVAHSMLLRDQRRELHGRVAEVLQRRADEGREQTAPEILAHHYTRAEMIEPAVQYWLAAGLRTFRVAAYREADSHLRRGLKLLERLPEGGPRARLGLELRAAVGLVRDGSRGYGHAFQSTFAVWRGGGTRLPPSLAAQHRDRELDG
jgi:predicted ATPase